MANGSVASAAIELGESSLELVAVQVTELSEGITQFILVPTSVARMIDDQLSIPLASFSFVHFPLLFGAINKR